MNTQYAIILQNSQYGIVNFTKPYVVDRAEGHLRNIITKAFPRSLTVIGTMEFLTNNPFDLCEDDFKKPLCVDSLIDSIPADPYGTKWYVGLADTDDKANQFLQLFENLVSSQDFEDRLMKVISPESETYKFIENTRAAIQNDNLMQMSAVAFDRGGVPIDVLVAKAGTLRVSFENIARELNNLLSGDAEEFSFMDSSHPEPEEQIPDEIAAMFNSVTLKPYTDY